MLQDSPVADMLIVQYHNSYNDTQPSRYHSYNIIVLLDCQVWHRDHSTDALVPQYKTQ